MQNSNNPELEHIFKWFLGFIKPTEWQKRKKEIESHLEAIHKPKKSRQDAINHESISFPQHNRGLKISWYLYLVETYLTEPTKYEPHQGARIIPIFERLGTDFELLQQINGITEKVKKLFYGRTLIEPDATLFEILVALLWKRNGWENISFIPELNEKTPDIRAASGNNEWFIECKRLNGSSEYSQKERKKWLKMWIHLRDYLLDKQIPALLEITFHIELEPLPDDFLVKQLAGKLPLLSSRCVVISNEQWQVNFDTVNFNKIRKHLEQFKVKNPSTQLCELIAGCKVFNRGFTSVHLGKNERIGKGFVNNSYLTDIDFAAGAFWSCDADESINSKARDIKKQLIKATEQLPKDKKSVIHVGLETLDGVFVENTRYEKIFNTAMNFDNHGKDLRWIYCHLFQSYSPPEQDWVFDETVSYFTHSDFYDMPPLKYTGVIATGKNAPLNSVHWLRDTP